MCQGGVGTLDTHWGMDNSTVTVTFSFVYLSPVGQGVVSSLVNLSSFPWCPNLVHIDRNLQCSDVLDTPGYNNLSSILNNTNVLLYEKCFLLSLGL